MGNREQHSRTLRSLSLALLAHVVLFTAVAADGLGSIGAILGEVTHGSGVRRKVVKFFVGVVVVGIRRVVVAGMR